MSRRYKKIKEDMPLLAAKIEDDTPRQVARPSSKTNVIYLLLSTSVLKSGSRGHFSLSIDQKMSTVYCSLW